MFCRKEWLNAVYQHLQPPFKIVIVIIIKENKNTVQAAHWSVGYANATTERKQQNVSVNVTDLSAHKVL